MLRGKSVLITRPKHQAAEMAGQLEQLGAAVIMMPALEIAPLEDTASLDDALRRLSTFDWVVLTSVNGVRAVVSRMGILGIPVKELASVRLAVIGPATARELSELVRAPDLMPAEFVSESIVEALGDVGGQRFLLARADKARRDLAVTLRERGAEVEEVAAYRILQAAEEGELPQDAPDYIVLTSSAGVRATHDLLGACGREHWMRESRLACIGPITAATVVELGLMPHLIAGEYTAPGLVEAIVSDATGELANV
ncbi:MAG: uroporphyrinogen-III synthase [Fimbriimonas sp.]